MNIFIPIGLAVAGLGMLAEGLTPGRIRGEDSAKKTKKVKPLKEKKPAEVVDVVEVVEGGDVEAVESID
ncbi:MAG: hypothetical protein JKY86_07680 [Gammaproteobacteria bacterium]|nr:hypothetical protein [Gammaproteobacteria bacterium]MBL4572939.1 hypothetical protein [Gammaproteobacteria bacterium]